MKNSLPYIVNIPPFMYTGVNIDSFNALQKIVFFIKGKILSFIINRTSEGIFCFFINLFYKKDGKIYFKNNFYIKNLRDGDEIYYPNKRILRVVNNHKLHFNKIIEYLEYTDDSIELIVLDEPNSNLDDEGERELLTALRKLRESGSTIIVITHRTSILAIVDKLLLLTDGTVRAFGKRDQVLKAIEEAKSKVTPLQSQAAPRT